MGRATDLGAGPLPTHKIRAHIPACLEAPAGEDDGIGNRRLAAIGRLEANTGDASAAKTEAKAEDAEVKADEPVEDTVEDQVEATEESQTEDAAADDGATAEAADGAEADEQSGEEEDKTES